MVSGNVSPDSNHKPNLLTLHLVVVKGEWRVYDLSMGDIKSYRSDLAKANKDAAAGHY